VRGPESKELRVYPIDIEDLIERSFSKASEAAEKEEVTRLKPIVKARIKERTRLKVASNLALRPLIRLESSIPPASRLSPFHRDLLEALDAGELEEARTRIRRVIARIKRLRLNAFRKLNAAKRPSSMQMIRKAAYGRISSELRSLESTMEYLAKIGPRLREVPMIKFDLPTLVIAGCPNVGKTTLLKALTGSSPEIRPIPFTTQRIQLGYYQEGWKDVQVIDTPGLLDRPLDRRSPVEMKAVGAIRHLSDVVLFLIDPTMRSGFPLQDQIGLLRQMEEEFSLPLVVAINKVDLASEGELEETRAAIGDSYRVMEISSAKGDGLEDLQKLLSSYLKESVPES